MLLNISLFGPIGYVLCALSILTMTILLERLVVHITLPSFYRYRALLKKMLTLLNNQEFRSALALTQQLPKTLRRPLQQLISQHTLDPQLREQSSSLALINLRHKLQHRLNWLSLSAVIAPMLGLLGTIWGISHSFATFSNHALKADKLTLLIHYLAQAMWATAGGIFIAVISLIAVYALRIWSDSYLSELEQLLNRSHIAIQWGNKITEAEKMLIQETTSDQTTVSPPLSRSTAT